MSSQRLGWLLFDRDMLASMHSFISNHMHLHKKTTCSLHDSIPKTLTAACFGADRHTHTVDLIPC